jgi:lysophospholipase L1-like esterase
MNRIVFSLFIVISLACSKDELTAPIKPLEEVIEMEKTDTTFTYLALGDSYTIGESVSVNERFPVQLIEKLKGSKFKMEPAKIVARTGWTTDNLKSGIKGTSLDDTYHLLTLLIGVNNQYQGKDSAEYRVQFRELLQTAIRLAQDNPKNVIVVSISDYGVTPFAENRNTDKIGKEIDAFNKINLQETQESGAKYVDITSISRQAQSDPTLIASDGLHPSGKMYRLWVEKIFPEAKYILQNHN